MSVSVRECVRVFVCRVSRKWQTGRRGRAEEQKERKGEETRGQDGSRWGAAAAVARETKTETEDVRREKKTAEARRAVLYSCNPTHIGAAYRSKTR